MSDFSIGSKSSQQGMDSSHGSNTSIGSHTTNNSKNSRNSKSTTTPKNKQTKKDGLNEALEGLKKFRNGKYFRLPKLQKESASFLPVLKVSIEQLLEQDEKQEAGSNEGKQELVDTQDDLQHGDGEDTQDEKQQDDVISQNKDEGK